MPEANQNLSNIGGLLLESGLCFVSFAPPQVRNSLVLWSCASMSSSVPQIEKIILNKGSIGK